MEAGSVQLHGPSLHDYRISEKLRLARCQMQGMTAPKSGRLTPTEIGKGLPGTQQVSGLCSALLMLSGASPGRVSGRVWGDPPIL